MRFHFYPNKGDAKSIKHADEVNSHFK
jgi:hypothetical protein